MKRLTQDLILITVKGFEDIEAKSKDIKETELNIKTNTEILKIRSKDLEAKLKVLEATQENAEMVMISRIEESDRSKTPSLNWKKN